MLQNMSVVDNEVNIVSVCANCGKEGNDINNLCNKCKQVKYCNAACKKKHRSKHKKACEEHQRLAAELRLSYTMKGSSNNHRQYGRLSNLFPTYAFTLYGTELHDMLAEKLYAVDVYMHLIDNLGE